jgi:L-aminopeptidase/D-esterase-like protein
MRSGSATIGEGAHFWAASEEIGAEFGGLGAAPQRDLGAPRPFKGRRTENTTIALVATDAALTKAQARHVAAMAQGGLAMALRPVHTPLDGDTVFSASTGLVPLEDPVADLIAIGSAASSALARAVARAIYHATAVPGVSQAAWRDRFAAPAT